MAEALDAKADVEELRRVARLFREQKEQVNGR